MSNSLSKIQKSLFDSKQVVLIESFFSKTDVYTLGSNKAQAFTLLLKCEQLGFSFDNQLLNVVSHASENEMENLFTFIKEQAKNNFKAGKYTPMYPNFPKQVIKASELELLLNAFMHYSGDWFGYRCMPEYEKKERKDLKEEVNPLRVSVMMNNEIKVVFENLINSNASISLSSKELVRDLFNYLIEKDKVELSDVIANASIPQKEMLAELGAMVLNSELNFNTILSDKFKTPTDLLRLSSSLYGGDVSLSIPTKVGKMSRPMRRAFVSKLESFFTNGDKEQFLENMFSHKEAWTKLAHALHVGEYKSKCPNAFEAVQKLRSNEKGLSFNYKVNTLVEESKVLNAAKELIVRPGVFGRMLNYLLVNSKDEKEQLKVVDFFIKAAASISTPVLLQVHAKFKYDNQYEQKIIVPKGGLGKVFVKELSQADAPKLAVSDKVANKIHESVEDILVERFSHGDSLGNVYIDDSVKGVNIPFAQRSASKALKTVPKGSRFKSEDDKPIIRFFTWWNENGKDKDGKPMSVGRVDIDLSLVIFDKDYNLIETCAYYNLRTSDHLVHSGDITSAPNGAAEYIDVDIEKLKSRNPNAAFVGQMINSFTGQKYVSIPECYAGWMEREKMQHGKIFEPSTVKNKVDITSDAKQVLVTVFDVNTKEYIWADSPVSTNSYGRPNNVANSRASISYTLKGLVEMKKPKMEDLLLMHVKARGNLVNKKEDADVVFSLNEGVTPFDSEVIAAQFMKDEYMSLKNVKKVKP